MPANRNDSRLCKDIGSFLKVHKTQSNRELNVQSSRNSLLNSRALKLVLTGQRVAGGKQSRSKCEKLSGRSINESSNCSLQPFLISSASVSQPLTCHTQSLFGIVQSELSSFATSCGGQSNSQPVSAFVVQSVVDVDENAVFEPEGWQLKKPLVDPIGDLAAQIQSEAAALIDNLADQLTKEQTPQKRVRNSVERCCAFAFPKLAAFVNEAVDRLVTRASSTSDSQSAVCVHIRTYGIRLETLRSCGLLADAKQVESQNAHCTSQCATTYAARLLLTVHFHVLTRFALLFDHVIERKTDQDLHCESSVHQRNAHDWSLMAKQFVEEVIRLLRTLTFRVPESGSITVKILDAIFEHEFKTRRLLEHLTALCNSNTNTKASTNATGIAKWIESGGCNGPAGFESIRCKFDHFFTVFNEIYEELGVAPKRGMLERCGLVSAARSYTDVRDTLKRFTAFELEEEDSDAQSTSENEENTALTNAKSVASVVDTETRRSDRCANSTDLNQSAQTSTHVRRRSPQRSCKQATSAQTSKSASIPVLHDFGFLTDSPILNEAIKSKAVNSGRVSDAPRQRSAVRRSGVASARQSVANYVSISQSTQDSRPCTLSTAGCGNGDVVDGSLPTATVESSILGIEDNRSNMSISSGNSNSCAANVLQLVKRSTSGRNEALGFACASRQPRRVMVMPVPAASRRTVGSLQPRVRNNSQSHSHAPGSRDSSAKRSRASRALFGAVHTTTTGLPGEQSQQVSANPENRMPVFSSLNARTPVKRIGTHTLRKSPRLSAGKTTPRKVAVMHTPRRSLFDGGSARKRRRTDVQASVFDLDSQSSVNVGMSMPTTSTAGPVQSQSQSQSQSQRVAPHRIVPGTPHVLRNYCVG